MFFNCSDMYKIDLIGHCLFQETVKMQNLKIMYFWMLALPCKVNTEMSIGNYAEACRSKSYPLLTQLLERDC